MAESNFDRLINHFKNLFPDSEKSKIDQLGDYIREYIISNGFNVKFLNSCATGFAGVRTRDQIIICAPQNMIRIGDFIYVIFHEIRHEEQISRLKLENPLTDMDLDDFETLSHQYWELELDADSFAKKQIAKLIIDLDIPLEIAKDQFKLSQQIENYPMMSNIIKGSLKALVTDIRRMKNNGEEYQDIQDHPIVKRHLDKLERFL
jgi:hypothetical protein